MGNRRKLLEEQLAFLKENKAPKAKIEEVEKAIARSKKAKRSKDKGGEYERDTRDRFKLRFPVLDLCRTPQSGGFSKTANNKSLRGDVSNLNEEVEFMLHLECKDCKTWSLPAWIKQSRNDCPVGKIPTVVFHQQRLLEHGNKGKEIQKADDYICIRLEDFLQIVDETKIIVKKEE